MFVKWAPHCHFSGYRVFLRFIRLWMNPPSLTCFIAAKLHLSGSICGLIDQDDSGIWIFIGIKNGKIKTSWCFNVSHVDVRTKWPTLSKVFSFRLWIQLVCIGKVKYWFWCEIVDMTLTEQTNDGYQIVNRHGQAVPLYNLYTYIPHMILTCT